MELKTADHETLLAALDALGLRYTEAKNVLTIQTPNAGTMTIKNGKAEFYNEGCQQWINKLKQVYSLKTVERIAKRFKFTTTVKDDNKLVLRRY